MNLLALKAMKTHYSIRPGKLSDCEPVLRLIKELADYEKEPNAVEITVSDLERDGFGAQSCFELLIAESEGEVIGCALFYPRYSTWKGPTLYLEDLIVEESKRGQGIGTALLMELRSLAKERNAARLEWQVLDWNEPAIAFYKKMGVILDGEWLNCKLTKEQL